MDDSFSFGYWVRRRRKALDLTQVALARQVGCTESMLRKIEADARRPSKQIAERLAQALELPLTERVPFLKAARAELTPRSIVVLTQAVLRPLPTDSVQAPSAPQLSTMLPASPTALIGRGREVAALCALLARPDVRLVTLTGAGGSGKTRLALQVAAEIADAGAARFADGMHFVDLAPLADAALVAPTIARALDIPEVAGVTADERLRAALRERRALLVLDNFEQVVDAALLVSELLRASPGLAVLVTSRTALHLRGEREYPVGPLALASEDEGRMTEGESERDPIPPFALGPASVSPAAQLFIERAQAVQPNFTLSEANTDAVAAICQWLDGLPLAIELVAPRLRLFAPQALLTRIREVGALSLLTGGARDLPRRQQTIRATIDWSYRLLTSEEQLFFARLGVFVGGFTLEAAAAVMRFESRALGEDSDTTERSPVNEDLAVLEGLTAVADQNLLKQREDVGGEPRFAMLETIREYALERLEHVEELATRQRHAVYYLHLAEETADQLNGAEQQASLSRLAHEYDNARAALRWAQSTSNVRELELRLAAALGGFWLRRGLLSEGRALIERTISQLAADTHPRQAARVLIWAGRIIEAQGDALGSSASFARALALGQTSEDHHTIADAHCGLGMLAIFACDLVLARQHFAEAERTYRAINERWGLAWALNGLAQCAYFCGDYELGEQHNFEGLALFSELGDSWSIAWTLFGCGMHYHARAQLAQAADYFEQSLALYRKLREPRLCAYPLFGLAHVALFRQQYELAKSLAQEGLHAFQLVEDQRGVAVMQLVLGSIALAQHDFRQTLSYYRQALVVWRSQRSDFYIVECLVGSAKIAIAYGAFAAAARWLSAADTLARRGIVPIHPWHRDETTRLLDVLRAQAVLSALGETDTSGEEPVLESLIAETQELTERLIAKPVSRAYLHLTASVLHGGPNATTNARQHEASVTESAFSPVFALAPRDLTRPERVQHQSNLPAPATPLIGRSTETAVLHTFLSRTDIRLVTLVGTAGAGKTRLALHVARQSINNFADGVWFVALAAIHDPRLVGAAIARVFGVFDEMGGLLYARLRDYFHTKRLLLVLDNIEHLLEAGPFIAELLANAPGLTVLATSRSVWRLSAEHVVEVLPLAVPASTPPSELNGLTQIDSVALFLARAWAVRPDLALTPANLRAIAAICRQLDGLPLALELAAARSRVLSPPQLRDRLGGRLALLTGGARDLPPRQRTLRAALDWSYALLTIEEQALFARLSIFVGGCDLKAVQAVCGRPEDQEHDLLETLAALVDHSLVRRASDGEGTARFAMLETTSEYAREQLAARGELDQTRRRHAAFYVALAEAADLHLRTKSQPSWLALLEVEHPNLRTALAWCLAEGQDVQLGLRLSGALGWFWWLRGHGKEGLDWLVQGLALSSTATATSRAKALWCAGLLCVHLRDYQQGELWSDQALTLYRQLEDMAGISYAVGPLGVHKLFQGNSVAARGLWQEGLRHAYALSDSWNGAIHLFHLARLEADETQAVVLLEESLQLAGEVGERWSLTGVLSSLTWKMVPRGEFARAEVYVERWLRCAQEIGDTLAVVHALTARANVRIAQGNFTEPQALLDHALLLARTSGAAFETATVLHELGELHRLNGRYQEAQAYHRAALAQLETADISTQRIYTLFGLTMASLAQGDREQPRQRLAEAFARSDASASQVDQLSLLLALAGLAASTGHGAAAARLLGSVEGAYSGAGVVLYGADRAYYDLITATVLATLEKTTFIDAWQVGRALPLKDVLQGDGRALTRLVLTSRIAEH